MVIVKVLDVHSPTSYHHVSHIVWQAIPSGQDLSQVHS